MPAIEVNGSEFTSLARQLLGSGHCIRFQARGASMQPFISDGDILEVAPLNSADIQPGEVVLVEQGDGRVLAHRVIKVKRNGDETSCLIKGDSASTPDGWYELKQILGRVEIAERGVKRVRLTGGVYRMKARLWAILIFWAPSFKWVPAQFRRQVRDWLLTA